MWIYLLRHGIADEPRFDRPDDARELTDEGQQKLARCQPAWRQLVQRLDVVVSSPMVRARQTADVFVDAVSFADDVRSVPDVVPTAHPNLAMTMLEAELHGGSDGVAIVGHEPHLGYLLGSLLTGHGNLSVPFKRGMLVAVETDSRTSLVCGLRFSLTQKAAAQLGENA